MGILKCCRIWLVFNWWFCHQSYKLWFLFASVQLPAHQKKAGQIKLMKWPNIGRKPQYITSTEDPY